MKIKTSELTGPALDWAVWNCVGGTTRYPKTATGRAFLKLWQGNSSLFIHPSTYWGQGGPIIEQEKISIGFERYGAPGGETWDAVKTNPDIGSELEYGPTPLIAAMRCYVASKLGDEIEIPEELQ